MVDSNTGCKQKVVQMDLNDENALAQGRWSETDHVVRKIDYDNLE